MGITNTEVFGGVVMLEKSRQAVNLQAKCENCGKKVADGVAREHWPFSTGYCACTLSTPVLPESEPSRSTQTPNLVVAPDCEENQPVVEPVNQTANQSRSDTITVPERFELIEKLGEGGMGTVFSVRDKGLNQLNAIKFMKPELMKDRAAVKRFEKEAAAVSDLTHPNIAQVFGCGTIDGAAPYLMMEYVDGISLAELLRHEKSLAPARAIEIFLQVCEALEHAHRKGVVHRDLSPSNILIVANKDGSDGVKIVDFGIAKLAPVQGVTELTQNGDVLGSPKYMSPEQARGDQVDQRSDIYSLGCVMYETLAGKPLFVGVNGIQILMHQLNTPIKYGLTKLRARGVSKNLIAVVAKMLSKTPERRYQSATEVKNELSRIKAKQAPRVVIKQRLIIVAVLAAILVTGSTGTQILKLVPANQMSPMGVNQDASAMHSEWTVPRPWDNNPESWFKRVEKARAEGNPLDGSRLGLSHAETQYRLWESQSIMDDTREQLRKMGPSIIPALVNHSNDRQSDVCNICRDLLADFGEPSAKPLIDHMRARGTTPLDMSLICRIGRPVAAECINMISTGNEADQLLASKILVHLVDEANQRNHTAYLLDRSPKGMLADALTEADLAKILKAINQSHAIETKTALLHCLPYFAAGNAQVDSTLANELQKSNDKNVRLQALSSMGAILKLESPEAAAKTVPLIGKTLANDPDMDIRLACIKAVEELGNKADVAIPALRNATHDRVDSVHQAAVMALCKMALTNPAVAPDVMKALNDSDRKILHAAITALPGLHEKALPAVPRLLSIIDNDQTTLRWEALATIQQMGPEVASKAVPNMIRILQTGAPYDRRQIVSALFQMGSEAKAAIPILKKIAADPADPLTAEAHSILQQWRQAP